MLLVRFLSAAIFVCILDARFIKRGEMTENVNSCLQNVLKQSRRFYAAAQINDHLTFGLT
jgi:hypothetical protein